MGWEQRNGRSYYYRKVRHGRTVFSEYVPSFIAAYAVHLDTSERAARHMAHAHDRAARERHAARARLVLATLSLVRTLLAAQLRALGYHQHKGTWRKKRGEQVNIVAHAGELLQIPEEHRTEISDLVNRLSKQKKPDQNDTIKLHVLLMKYPTAWRLFGGDMGAHALHEMLDHVTGDAASRTLIEAGIAGIKRDLGYAAAPALEKLLIDAVAIAWLGYYDTQRRHAAVLAESHTIERGMYWQKNLTLAQGRYLRALETLARVRKMQLPALVQVNINQALPAPPLAQTVIEQVCHLSRDEGV